MRCRDKRDRKFRLRRSSYKNFNFVQIMGIEEIGKQGEAFTIFLHRLKIYAQHLSVIISIDGGVNLENAKRLKDAGVDRF
ncbi:MAG: hypothetical protein R3B65_03070 [Candidatus Paceibacterota bacterium]